MADNRDTVGTTARIVLLVFLAVLALTFALPGIVVYQSCIEDWANDPRGFYGIEGAVNWVFGVGSAGAIAVGLIVFGVILRVLGSTWTRLASLILSVISVGFIFLTYYVFSGTNTSSDSIDVVFLRVSSIVLLLLVALPPFLHWALNKPAGLSAPQEPRP